LLLQGGSFTLTLFLPFAALETIDTPDKARAFFNEHFPSAVKIAGEDQLMGDFERNPRGNLVTINVRVPFCAETRADGSRSHRRAGLRTRSCLATRHIVWFRKLNHFVLRKGS